MFVRFQKALLTRRHSQRPLAGVEHAIGAGTEGQQAFEALTQGCCLRRSAKKLKAPVDRCSCREESLANRLEQRWITHMRGLRKQAGGQIALCIDGKQLIELTCVSLDEFGG